MGKRGAHLNSVSIDAVSTDVSGAHLWLILMKAYRALSQVDARSIAASGLGISDFAVLEVLLHKGPLPVNAIGRHVMLTSGSITESRLHDPAQSQELCRLADFEAVER